MNRDRSRANAAHSLSRRRRPRIAALPLGILLALGVAGCGFSQSTPEKDAIPRACLASAKSGTPPAAGALPSHPTAADYNSLGTRFAQTNNPGCAIPAFEAGLALAPKAWEIRYNLALSLIRARDFSRSLSELREVMAEKPNSAKVHNALGLAREGAGQQDPASEAFKTAIKIDPHYASALYNLGHLLSSEKRYEGAIYYFQQALAVSPPLPLAGQVEAELAAAYAENQDYPDSIRVFKNLLASQPGSTAFHFDLANAYAHNNQFAEAAGEYKKTLELDPANQAARLSLAKALMTLYEVPQALPYLREYTKAKPGDAEGYEILGEALKYSGRYREAAAALKRAVKMDASNYRAHYNLGFVLERSGHLDEAIAQLEEAKKLKPDGSEALYELGIALAKQKDTQAAQRQFRQFQTVKESGELETRAGVVDRQASAELHHGRVEDAVKTYRDALKIRPGDAKIHYNLSLALAKLGDPRGEEGELAAAVKLDPKFAQAHNQLGLCYLADGRLADAERELKAALDADPGYAEAENNLGVLYGREGKNALAAGLFRRATTDNPQYAEAYFNWGLVLAAGGQDSEAETRLEKAIALSPNDPHALYQVALAERQLGDLARSTELLTRVVKLDPGNSQARHLLNQNLHQPGKR